MPQSTSVSRFRIESKHERLSRDNSSKTFTLLLKDEVVAKLELFRIIYCQSSIGFAGRFRSFVARSLGAPGLVARFKNSQQLPAAQR